MAGTVLDPRVINNKTLLSVTGGSVVIQMTGIKRWFYLLGIRNISIINFHQQQQSVWREDLLAGFIGIPRKIMALKNLKAIIIDLNYIKGILFFLDLTGE